MLKARVKKCVWVFSLAVLDQSVQTIRFLGPFGYFPQDEYEFIYVPSVKAISKILRVPDIIVLQRLLYPLGEMRKIIGFARSRKIPVVLELDDLIVDVPPQHPSHYWHEEIKAQIKDLIRSAGYVTVTNDRLKEYLEPYNPNILIAPNLIDERIWFQGGKREDTAEDKITIGYAGSVPHIYDLEIVTPAIKHILSKYAGRVSFKFIGCITEELRNTDGVYYIPEANPYTKYAGLLRNCGFDFVLAVLEDNAFGRSKSNMKFLEYSICAYPGIYSMVGPYADSVTHNKTGLLVKNTTEDWVDAMESLIGDPSLRKRLGENARDHVRENYSLQKRWTQWYRLYSDIIAAGKREGEGALSVRPLLSYGPYMLYAGARKMARALLKGAP